MSVSGARTLVYTPAQIAAIRVELEGLKKLVDEVENLDRDSLHGIDLFSKYAEYTGRLSARAKLVIGAITPNLSPAQEILGDYGDYVRYGEDCACCWFAGEGHDGDENVCPIHNNEVQEEARADHMFDEAREREAEEKEAVNG